MAQNHSTITNPSAFPLGVPNDAYAKYFIGQSYLAPLVSGKEINVSNVTFEAGCRNNWHIHHKACQILIAVGGHMSWVIGSCGSAPVSAVSSA